jgi:hypothetical protein
MDETVDRFSPVVEASSARDSGARWRNVLIATAVLNLRTRF